MRFLNQGIDKERTTVSQTSSKLGRRPTNWLFLKGVQAGQEEMLKMLNQDNNDSRCCNTILAVCVLLIFFIHGWPQ